MPAAEPARHERPEVDEAALRAARSADRMLQAARDREMSRWVRFFEAVPDVLRDGTVKELRGTAMRARSAYGPKDSVRDSLPAEVTEPLLADLDRLLKVLARDALRQQSGEA